MAPLLPGGLGPNMGTWLAMVHGAGGAAALHKDKVVEESLKIPEYLEKICMFSIHWSYKKKVQVSTLVRSLGSIPNVQYKKKISVRLLLAQIFLRHDIEQCINFFSRAFQLFVYL